MTLLLEQFRQNFDPHPIPQLLQDLLAFQNRSNEWYSDHFELDVISKAGLKTYFGENEEVLAQFLEFGHYSDGSSCALWLYKDMRLEDAPIVYFDSDAQGDTVVANNLPEFLTLLAWDEEMRCGWCSQTEDDLEHTARNQEFRVWIWERYHLKVASNPNEVIFKAKQNHPDLQEWIQRKQ